LPSTGMRRNMAGYPRPSAGVTSTWPVCAGAPPPGGGTAQQFHCVGDPPRQTDDPLSPPCVGPYRGDNGGATSMGVSRGTIKVVLCCSSSTDNYNQAAKVVTDDRTHTPAYALLQLNCTDLVTAYMQASSLGLGCCSACMRGPPCMCRGVRLAISQPTLPGL